MVASDYDHEVVLAALLEEIYQHLQAGQQVDLGQYQSEYPAYLKDLEELLPTLKDLAAWCAGQGSSSARRNTE